MQAMGWTGNRLEHGVSVDDLMEDLASFRAEMEAQATKKWDRVVEMRGMTFDAQDGKLLASIDGETFPLVGNAIRTLSNQLDLRGRFIESCLELNLHDHAALTFQRFLAARMKVLKCGEDYKLMIRCRNTDQGPVIRAFVGEKYGKFDNQDALSMVLDVLPVGVGEPVPLKQYGDEDELRGTLLFPETKVARKDDSDYYLGLFYRNSEVCRSAFGVSPFLFRSFCTNTAIYGQKEAGVPDIHIIHYGDMDFDQIRGEVTDGVRAALDTAPNLLKLLGYNEKVKVQEPQAVIAYLSKENGLSPHDGQCWYAGYLQEELPNAAGIIHGLTRGAQEKDGEARLRMEEVGGLLLAPGIMSDLADVKDEWDVRLRGAARFAKKHPGLVEKYTVGEPVKEK